jgi:hypothetical protein
MKIMLGISILLFCFGSCQSGHDSDQQASIQIYGQPFDTAAAIKEYALAEQMHYPRDSFLLDDEYYYPIDTFVISHSSCACGTYPEWINTSYFNDSAYRHYYKQRYYSLLNGMNQSWVSDTSKAENAGRYYVEPIHPSIELPWRIICDGNKIKFFGYLMKKPQMPNDKGGYIGHPPKAIKLVYFGYEILRPYSMWGPEQFVEMSQNTTNEKDFKPDSIFATAKLIIQ